MVGQMSIFEFLPQEADFCDMPEDAVMEIVSQRIGVRLVRDPEYKNYRATVGKVRITAKISNYTVTHEGSETVIAGHKHIGCGWGTSKEGGGRPCDSIDDAVDYLQAAINRSRR